MKDPRIDRVFLVIQSMQEHIKELEEELKTLQQKVNELERKANAKAIEAEFEKMFTPEKLKELAKGIFPTKERLREIANEELERILEKSQRQ